MKNEPGGVVRASLRPAHFLPLFLLLPPLSLFALFTLRLTICPLVTSTPFNVEGEKPNPFYAPQQCRESLERRQRDFEAQLARERTEAGR